jgi:hypothetical protein
VVVADAREAPKGSAVAAKQTGAIEVVLPGGFRVMVHALRSMLLRNPASVRMLIATSRWTSAKAWTGWRRW